MNRLQRQQTRSSMDAARRQRAQAALEQRRLREAHDRKAIHALAKPIVGEAAQVERALGGDPTRPHDPLFRKVQGTLVRSSSFDSLLRHVAREAPRLIDPVYVAAIYRIAEQSFVRPLDAWKPRGKGRDSLFRSLVDHLLASYRTPPFVWTAFFSDDAAILAPIAAHVARGGSLYDAVKDGRLPVPLTRKMCHELLQSTSDLSFVEAIRRVQVNDVGGDLRLLHAWMGSVGRQLQVRHEPFWLTVLAWFAKNPMLDRTEVGPIVDYIRHRRGLEPTFSMKGRSALALLSAMHAWHRELNQIRNAQSRGVPPSAKFTPSGLRPGTWDRSRRSSLGDHVRDVWHVTEILSAKDLLDEGRAMHHCVYSYAGQVLAGKTTIWSLTHEDSSGHWRMLTLEVQRDTKRIVQARGVSNRPATAQEHAILVAWAEKNALGVSIGRW